VHQFSRIGSRSFIGLGSVVTQDIPPFSTAAGNRARAVGINKVGLARKGFSHEAISALHKTFRLLLKSRKSREDALVDLQPLIDEYPEVSQLVEFIVNSERGIAR
jgi:UDP-N-acetylglucosamine acyltransferase